jgi:hypothetical protein
MRGDPLPGPPAYSRNSESRCLVRSVQGLKHRIPIKAGETGPDGYPILYLKNGDKVEVLPNHEDPDGEPWHMMLGRNDKVILKAREEFWEKVWWNRHQN